MIGARLRRAKEQKNQVNGPAIDGSKIHRPLKLRQEPHGHWELGQLRVRDSDAVADTRRPKRLSRRKRSRNTGRRKREHGTDAPSQFQQQSRLIRGANTNKYVVFTD
jgi:hypothetical protein